MHHALRTPPRESALSRRTSKSGAPRPHHSPSAQTTEAEVTYGTFRRTPESMGSVHARGPSRASRSPEPAFPEIGPGGVRVGGRARSHWTLPVVSSSWAVTVIPPGNHGRESGSSFPAPPRRPSRHKWSCVPWPRGTYRRACRSCAWGSMRGQARVLVRSLCGARHGNTTRADMLVSDPATTRSRPRVLRRRSATVTRAFKGLPPRAEIRLERPPHVSVARRAEDLGTLGTEPRDYNFFGVSVVVFSD